MKRAPQRVYREVLGFLCMGELAKFYTGKRQGTMLVESTDFTGITIEGTVIDLETTGLKEGVDEIVSIGLYGKQTAKVLCRTRDMDSAEFADAMRKVLLEFPPPYYAYNADFEDKFMKEVGISLDWIDLQDPLHALTTLIQKESVKQGRKVWVKWPQLKEIIATRFPRYFGVKGWDIGGGEVPELWEQHRNSGDLEPLGMIVQHNMFDIIEEAQLLMWLPSLNLLASYVEDPANASAVHGYKCDVCGKQFWESPKMAYLAGVQKKKPRGHLRYEMDVCTDCLQSKGLLERT